MIRVHRTCEGCGRKFTQDHAVGTSLRAFCDECLDAGRHVHYQDCDIRCEGSDIEDLEYTQHTVRWTQCKS